MLFNYVSYLHANALFLDSKQQIFFVRSSQKLTSYFSILRVDKEAAPTDKTLYMSRNPEQQTIGPVTTAETSHVICTPSTRDG